MPANTKKKTRRRIDMPKAMVKNCTKAKMAKKKKALGGNRGRPHLHVGNGTPLELA